MIIVTGHLTIDPAQRPLVEDAVAAVVTATTAEEGNVEYRFSIDLGDPGRLNMLEIWQDQAAIDVHMGTPHLAEFMTAIGPAIAGEVSITSHEVASSTKII